MIKYRLGMFETNSSSTHSIIIGMEDDFKKWENGELLYNRYNHSFCTKEEAINILKESPWYNKRIDFDNIEPEELEERLRDAEFYTCEWFDDGDELEHDYNEFITPNGEKICMLCRYGYDG